MELASYIPTVAVDNIRNRAIGVLIVIRMTSGHIGIELQQPPTTEPIKARGALLLTSVVNLEIAATFVACDRCEVDDIPLFALVPACGQQNFVAVADLLSKLLSISYYPLPSDGVMGSY